MNHLPFENWLLSDEPLSLEQTRALQEHLSTCETCCQLEAGWDSLQTLLQEAPVDVPAPGFTQRWQARQAEQRRKAQRRQSWILFLINGAIAAGLLAILGYSALNLLEQPDQILIIMVYRLMTLTFQVASVGDFISAVMNSLLGAVPLAAWIGLVGLSAMLSVLWFVVFKQLITHRRILQ